MEVWKKVLLTLFIISLILPISYAELNEPIVSAEGIDYIEYIVKEIFSNPYSISFDKDCYQPGDKIQAGVCLPVDRSKCENSIKYFKIWWNDGKSISTITAHPYFSKCTSLAICVKITIPTKSSDSYGEHKIEYQFYDENWNKVTPKESATYLLSRDPSCKQIECKPHCGPWSKCIPSPTEQSSGYQTRNCIRKNCENYVDERECNPYPDLPNRPIVKYKNLDTKITKDKVITTLILYNEGGESTKEWDIIEQQIVPTSPLSILTIGQQKVCDPSKPWNVHKDFILQAQKEYDVVLESDISKLKPGNYKVLIVTKESCASNEGVDPFKTPKEVGTFTIEGNDKDKDKDLDIMFITLILFIVIVLIGAGIYFIRRK